ncbi:hypothetical protein BBJ28_00008395 [Nothophytophthora sp. Chile5]|nr:hypothetical protein BBJ28_00008395 [Nothophytophthora sp. Chile5]
MESCRSPTWKTLLLDDLTPRLPDLVASCGWEDAVVFDQTAGKRLVENAYELSGSGERDAPRGKRKKRQQQQPQRKRRTTYEIRKQQKSDLVSQVKMMQTQLDELKYRVLVEQGEAASSLERTAAANSVLQECIQNQHVALADMQAMLASHIVKRKLREGKRFITARSRGLDPRASYSHEERYETPGDDFCVMRFDNAPIYGSSVKAVFDAIIHSVLHSEIIISEMFGSITIREDNDFDDNNLSQLRLVSSTSRGAMVESNSVMFSEFLDGADGKEDSYGLVASAFDPTSATRSDETSPQKSTRDMRSYGRGKRIAGTKGDSTTSKPHKKPRTTYEIRKEQKETLTAQVQRMQTQLDELKFRVLVEQGEAAKSNERTAAANSVLQECIQEQHLTLADMQAMLAGHAQQNLCALHPAQTIIRLGTDRVERHKTLMALKSRKLREAKNFITSRSRGLDSRSVYSQEERFDTPGEDFCLVLFEQMPVHGVSPKAVFDAFIEIAQSAEIVISELFGSITIREDNECDDAGLSHMRLVSSTSQGTMVESNTVMFSEFSEDEEGCCGVVVADFVDSDELYPYRPKERMSGLSMLAERETLAAVRAATSALLYASPWASDDANSPHQSVVTHSDHAHIVLRELRADEGRGKRGAQELEENSKNSSPKKPRTSHEIRKQQKKDMVEQVERMQAQLDALKFRVLVEKGEAAKSHKRISAASSVLHEYVQKQHVALAEMQAMIACHVQRDLLTLHPVYTVIRLGTNPVERQKTLMALKSRALREAECFLTARSRGLDPRSSYCQEERFHVSGGDFSVVRVDNVPINGGSAKAVFDAVIHCVLNAETILSDMFGCVTIREDNDFEDSDVAQIRLVSSTSHGAIVESNTVMFSEFSGGKGVIASHFVDSDQLYPYNPDERVRRDTSTIVMVRSLAANDSELAVLVTRWTCLKVHCIFKDASQDPECELRESSVCWGDTAQKYIQQRLGRTGIIDSKKLRQQ